MFSLTKARAGAALAVVAVIVAATTLAGGVGEDAVSPAQPQGVQTHPLDLYPGFGTTPAASGRDETIAAWEAFRKQRHIAGCMRSAGFEYEIEVSYPVDELQQIAANLNLPDKPAPRQSPEETNDRRQADLPAERRDPYFSALYGETAAAHDRVAASGGMTDDEDFATGGCTGAADLAIGSVWSANRELQPQLEAVGRAAGSAAAGQYSACAQRRGGLAASKPGDIEARLASPDLPKRTQTRLRLALRTCMPVWERAYSRAEQERLRAFVLVHSAVLEAARKRYLDAIRAIRADSEFLAFLAVHG